MPELPEVEHVVRSLRRARLRGRVQSVWRSEFDLRTGQAWRRDREGSQLLVGLSPARPERRAKFVLWPFSSKHPATPSRRLLLHLGMSGRLTVEPGHAPLALHTHLRIRFEDGREVRFVDPRRFGGFNVDAADAQASRPPLRDLGPEPLRPGFDGATLAAALGRSTRPLRDGLLDQRVVAGLGNIYVNEALFEAGLHPLIKSRRLRGGAWNRLADAVVSVLRRGIANGGTTLRDYRDAQGRAGRNQSSLRVYGRAGAPCLRCGHELEGFVLGGRSGAYCPRCQPNPRTRWVG